MKKILFTLDQKINTMVILLAFWAIFWFVITYRTIASPFSITDLILTVVYLITALSFTILTVFEILPNEKQKPYQLIHTRCLHRLTFKLTLLIFFISLIHSLLNHHFQLVSPIATFFALGILTYNTWYTTDTFMQENSQSSAPNPQSGQYLKKE